MVLSEVDKVEKWKQSCMEVLGTLIEDENSLLGALKKVSLLIPLSSHLSPCWFGYNQMYLYDFIYIQMTQTLERSLYICNKSCGSEARDCFSCCFNDSWNQEFLTCSICQDW